MLIFTGCAQKRYVLRNVSNDYQALSKNKALVVGKINLEGLKYVYKKIKVTLVNNDTRDKHIINLGSYSFFDIFEREDDISMFFLVELPAGSYIVERIHIDKMFIHYPRLNFTITEESSINYVGTINIKNNVKEFQQILGSTSIDVRVLDQKIEMVEYLRSNLPELNIDDMTPMIMDNRELTYDVRYPEGLVKEGELKDYFDKIIKRLDDRFTYNHYLIEGEVHIELTINRKGRVTDIDIDKARSIDNDDIQKLIRRVIRKYGRFDPIPPSFNTDEVKLPFIIHYFVRN